MASLQLRASIPRGEFSFAINTSHSEEVINATRSSDFDLVCNLCKRFSKVVQYLKKRYADREPLEIKDEHDVQNLFRALLSLYFDDIRPEEPAPSTAGSSSKMDFLLTRERIGIETKMTRSSLRDRELKEELSIDLKCYSKHPGFDTLIFFVYDTDKFIENPGAFETDFNEDGEGRCTRVFISQ